MIKKSNNACDIFVGLGGRKKNESKNGKVEK